MMSFLFGISCSYAEEYPPPPKDFHTLTHSQQTVWRWIDAETPTHYSCAIDEHLIPKPWTLIRCYNRLPSSFNASHKILDTGCRGLLLFSHKNLILVHPKVLGRVDVRAPSRPVRFFYTMSCMTALPCGNRKDPSPNCCQQSWKHSI